MSVDVSGFNLVKATETLDRFLLEKGIGQNAPTMRVGAAIDISGSMSSAYRSGEVQKTLNRLVPIGLKFDDNGEIDVFKFDNRCEYVETATPQNYETFVRDHNIGPRGGTEYAPVVTKALDFFELGKKKGLLSGLFSKNTAAAKADPVLMLILTDGDCSDSSATERALVAAQQHDIYWHFVGVGGASFRTIRHLADKLPNVGDVYLKNFSVSDEELYGQIISVELVTWVGKF